jgi:hypothetical protein
VIFGRREGIGAKSSLGSASPCHVGNASEFVGKDGRGGNKGGTDISDVSYVVGAGVVLFCTAGRIEDLPLGDGP